MRKAKVISLILGVTIMSFIVGCLVLAWTEPSQAPPGGNVAAPLNVGSTAQAKTGSLSFPIFYDSDNSTYYVNPAGTTVLSGNVGIGATSPGYKLDVNGALRLQASSAPTGANGVMYYDSSTNKFRCYQNGAWTDCIGAGSGVAPVDATYVLMSLNSTLTSERVLTAGTGISITDGLANGNVTITNTAGGTITGVTAGSGLTGGGTSGDVTLNVGAGTGITVGADTVGLTYPTQTCSSGYAIQSLNLASSAPTCVATSGGSGTVTSVGGNIGLVADPSPITTSGNIQLNISSISTCTNTTTSKIIWDSSNYKLICATDQSGGLTGSGTTNYAAKWTGSTSLGNSQIYDDGTNVGVGLTSPSVKLDVNGAIMPRTYLDMYNAASGIRDWNGSYGSSGQVLTKGSSGVVWGSASGGTLNCTWVGTSSYGTTCDADCPSGYLRTGCGGGVVTNAAAWRFLLRTNGCRVMADGTRDLECYAICCKIQ